MQIGEVIHFLEGIAPAALQEKYDNAGLLTGNAHWQCTGVLCCLDAIETVVDEAIAQKCNLIISHHPIIFSGLKKLNGSNYIERTIIKAIKNDIAIYAIHTNLDNVLNGVNGKIAEKLGLENVRILYPNNNVLKKLYFYVPECHAQQVKDALFLAGAGNIGNYSECSFTVQGVGSFKPNANANPYLGAKEKRHEDSELKIEILFPAYLENKLITELLNNHPYEEVAYEIISLDNRHQEIGAGVIGELANEIDEQEFLALLKSIFGLKYLKHTALLHKPIKKVAVCGGAGSFLLKNAINLKSDIYVSSDFKYHEYFNADNQILMADIGHYESEQFTIELLVTLLEQKFPNFAILKTAVTTNPVHYF